MTKEVISKSDDLVWHPFTVYNDCRLTPYKIVGAKNEFLYDSDGNCYVDLVSSWWTNVHGHCHLKLVEEISEQAQQLDHIMFNDFTHQPAIDLAYELLTRCIKQNGKVLFSDCGSASIEIAMKIAHQYHINRGKTKNNFVALKGGYHGDTFGAMALSKSLNLHHHFNDKLIEVDFLPSCYEYVGKDNSEQEKICLENIENFLTSKVDDISFVIFEPLVQGANGMKMMSKRFCNRLLEICSKLNIITIADEVMTGFGRTGRMFAVDYFNITPDIVCLSKGLSGGMLPLASTVVSSKIADCFNGDGCTLIHGHTFTANPIVCKLAYSSIMLFDEENTLDKIQNINSLYNNILEDLVSQLGLLGLNYRICGSILAFDLNREIKFGSQFSSKIREEFFNNGLVLRPIGNSFYFLPPYCISTNLLEECIFKTVNIIKKLL